MGKRGKARGGNYGAELYHKWVRAHPAARKKRRPRDGLRKARDGNATPLTAPKFLCRVSVPRQKTSDIPKTAGSAPRPCQPKDGCEESCPAHGPGSAASRLPSVLPAQFLDCSDT